MTAIIRTKPPGRHQSRKAAASGWIGSALEYYDFFIYATAASLVFPQVFFPSENPRVAIIASLATFGVGYVARPIGAFVLGHFGDTHGRKNVLLLCLFLMGFSTLAVGFLPTYAQVGLLAPTLLVILRLVQGFAVAGEISGASSMILEHAPFGRRGFFASFTIFATVAPPGTANIPTLIGSIAFGITVVAAAAAWSCRETYRGHMHDLGNPAAVPVPKPEYDRLRIEAIQQPT